MERFSANPGDEDDRFEAKRKAKLADRAGRADVVKILCAMANTRGGTLLVGIGSTAEHALVLDHFPPDSEAIAETMTMARDRTRPTLDTHLTAEWGEYGGKRLLRIDVTPSQEVVSFRTESGDWVAYRRVHSTTRQMTPDEIRVGNKRDRTFGQGPTLLAHAHLPGPAVDVKRKLPKGFERRVLTEANDDYQPVFGEGSGVEGFERPALYHLKANANMDEDPRSWANFLKLFAVKAQGALDDLTFSVKVGTRILCGAGVEDLLQDVANIVAVGQKMLREPPNAPDAFDQRFLPLVTGFVPYGLGFFWFQAEYQGHSGRWFRQECGFVFSDLPFNDKPLRDFFDAIGSEPSFYEAAVFTQGFTIHGHHLKLKRPQQVAGIKAGDDFLFVEADNPYYGKANDLDAELEGRVYRELIEGFCSIPRLMVQVAGGRIQSDRSFQLRHIEVFHKSLRSEILFINALAFAWQGARKGDKSMNLA